MKSIKTTDGRTIKRVSRWITVYRMNPTKRHPLYRYSVDEFGRMPSDPRFNPIDGTILDYFVFKGKMYALDQFKFKDELPCYCENGIRHFISGEEVGVENPLLLESDGDDFEKVRIYKRISQ